MMIEVVARDGAVPGLAPGTWTNDAQYLYSLLWSAFLDLDKYTASRALRRFRPYSTEWVVKTLLEWRPGAIRMEERAPDSAPVRLAEPFEALALWVITPRLLEDPGRPRIAVGERALRPLEVERIPEAFRTRFEKHFRVPISYRRDDAGAQSTFPPLPELGIGPATIEVTAGRRVAKATMRSPVQVPYKLLSEIVDPSKWNDCDHIVVRGDAEDVRSMTLRLPGGGWDDAVKHREMELRFEKSSGPFEARIDYFAKETKKRREAQSDSDERLDPGAEANEDVFPSEDNDSRQVDGMRGFLAVRKMQGRPGWSYVVAERTISFESPNHDRFRVETLIFWHVVELMSFVLACCPKEPEKKVQE